MCVLAALAAGLLLPRAASGQQNDVTVNVHHVTAMPIKTAEGMDAYQVSATFSLLRPDGSPIKPENVQATIKQDSGELPRVGVQPIGGSSSMVVVADASNAKAFTQIRQALVEYLGSAQNANIGLLTFGERPKIENNLTGINDELKKRLPNLAGQTGRACVNDALAQAIGMLKGSNAPRAVFLITASRDVCNNITRETLVAQAKSDQVEIYTAGLSGYTINETELQSYSAPTGGISRMIQNDNAANLRFALQNYQQILFSQVVASWNTYPKVLGVQKGQLIVVSSGRQLDPQPVEYPNTVILNAPSGVEIKGVQCVNQRILLTLALENQDAIKALSLSVNTATGQEINRINELKVLSNLSVAVPNLTKGAEYFVTVTAFDEARKKIGASQPAKCAYAEDALAVSVTAVDPPTLARPSFIITTSANNEAGVASYKIWLENNGQVVRESETIVRTGETKIIPNRNLGGGQYLARAQALDSANAPISAPSAPFEVNYQSPNLLDRVGFWFRQDLPLRGGAVTVALAALALGIFGSIRLMRKREEPSPWLDVGLAPGKQQQQDSYEAKVSVPASRLVLVSPAKGQRTFIVDHSPFSIGRGAANDAVLKVDSSISSNHAVLVYANSGWFVQDRNSANGTFLNGLRLAPEERVEVQSGTVIGFGKMVKLRFEQVGVASAAQAPDTSMSAPKQAAVLASLRLMDVPGMAVELPITGGQCAVGRSKENDVCIPLDATSGISNKHAVIFNQGGQWMIRDNGSTNGTYVDAKPIPPKTGLPLRDGAIIGLGSKIKAEFRVK